MRFAILFLFTFCCLSLQAQDIDEDVNIGKSVPGYIITNDGDTIEGRVKVQTRSKNQVKVKFTKAGDGQKQKSYKPKNALGYGYLTEENNQSPQRVDKWRHFLRKKSDQPAIPFGSTNVFMEVKATGKARLYSFYKQNNGQVEYTYLHYYFLEFEDGSRERKISQNDFDWAVPAFLEDCSRIRNLIESHGYSKLEEIVSDYNKCTSYKIDKPECGCDDLGTGEEDEKVEMNTKKSVRPDNNK